jgi:shikimate kinase
MVMGLPLTTRNLIITGYIEPNRPRLAQQIASQLRMTYVDVEQLLEQRLGSSPETLRRAFGDRRLKTLEAELMAEVVLNRQTVIRVNGSTLMHGDHFARLQATGPIFCLVMRLDAILQRLHLALGTRYHNPAERAAALGELQREWAVRKQTGLLELDVTYQEEPDIIALVIARWQQIAIERA